ncbi:MAG: S-methyl-5'-thioadenosine phosphorylase [Armatimonadota bacterium]|jgi:5'-methylthioadenosine phosphorylase
MQVAIIGGTGVYALEGAGDVRRENVQTAYGHAEVVVLRMEGKEIAFMARHGEGHTIAPHRINYRANIAALKELSIRSVIATNAVGSLREEWRPPALVLIDQFIDNTKGRADTFFDGGDGDVQHVDMTEPYCPRLREAVRSAAGEQGIDLHDGGTYLCAEGPRFETPAEIRMYRSWGADLVGMTNYPEVALAREAGICYAAVCLVTNLAAGISAAPLSHLDVVASMEAQVEQVRELVLGAALAEGEGGECSCREPMA